MSLLTPPDTLAVPGALAVPDAEQHDDETVALSIRGISKQYTRGPESGQSILSGLGQLGRSLLRLPPAPGSAGSDPFWALRDVSFDVHHGERVGIIGHNGAGKSTLLKILSRVVYPTYGEIWIRGRVTSLLEVGTGFHTDLTGRENVYLNGAIRGLRREEIDARFESIVEFAEVEAVIDTPVKRYSSGMQVRLAFSVAAHLDPDILLLDEVFAVGDIAFQQKCMERVNELVSNGRTLLFVSHSHGTVRTRCERVIWMDKGRLRLDGPADDVVAAYLESLAMTDDDLLDV